MDPGVYILGAGPGDPELITIKAKRVLARADVIIYADSLVNPAILSYAKKSCEIHKSSSLSLEEIEDLILRKVKEGKLIARLHSGDPSLYGAIREQISLLEKGGITYEIIPGVSSIFAAAAALKRELTVPELSQTVIITRIAGRTPVPEDLAALASHRAAMVLFLSVSNINKVVEKLVSGGYAEDTPVAVVYRASWADEKIVRGTLSNIVLLVKKSGIKKQALIMVGSWLVSDAIDGRVTRSKLYDSTFSHEYRNAREKPFE
ncbi:MAG: precorrin-4 C(11)-methyltransferase [Dehalococcoidia bacterium]|nr:precorrin-4 C(11)-methyltransferase [Dehalococcoidia bacterium]